MSLLLSEGHPHARHYPLGMVMDEVTLASLRINNLVAVQAVLMQLVVSSMFSEESGKSFSAQIKRLTNGH